MLAPARHSQPSKALREDGLPGMQALADKQARMELALQQSQSDLKHHLDSCTDAQTRTVERFDAIDKRLDGIADSLKDISEAQSNAKAVREAMSNGRRWWHPLIIALVVAVMGCVTGLIGWMGSTIFTLENAKIDNRPAATVTVNPAQSAAPYAAQPVN